MADVYETENTTVISLEISGISKNDIITHLSERVLIIKGIRKEKVEHVKRTYYRMEINYGPFERQFVLITPVDTEKLDMKYEGGFLTITLYKLCK